ncbi:hypothetical protein F5972_32795 [Microbispora cellulosiformans]|uniref:Uncharacterized protein n=1 Tax=Microbispora cellulosiformans TaxID=2614688 RepID=A0A5J5JS78_9ACTN|nr:hypothetical protein [Microbispora cellulosiformans]KAA9374019.1 hypothetical protein F5972_32795 [Microbispora cellulosiformans]
MPPQAGGGSCTPAAAGYPYASLTYMDVNGRAVNTGAYVAGRAGAAERADLLADVTAYNDGEDVVSGDGLASQAMLADGTRVSARRHNDYTYDEGKPDPDTDYHLVTTTTVQPWSSTAQA